MNAEDLEKREEPQKKPEEDKELAAELEAFRAASELSTSFVRRIPSQFEKVYRKSGGTAESMYKNCIHGFLKLVRNKRTSPVLYVRTLVYRLRDTYYLDLGEIKDPEEREKAQVTELQVVHAIHLFCIKASSLAYSREAARPLDREIRRELTKWRDREEEKACDADKSSGGAAAGTEGSEIHEIMLYLRELLSSEVLSVEMDRRDGAKSIREIEAERRRDKKRIERYERMVREIRVPLPESRLRDRYGQVHHPDAENKLGVSARVQKESDSIRSRLDEIRRRKAVLEGGERLVDLERRKFLEAALKRNQVLGFEKSRREISERQRENGRDQEARLRCECDQDEDCECRLVDLYGEALGRPVSLKLEEELLSEHRIFRNREQQRQAEVKYFRGLVARDLGPGKGGSRTMCRPEGVQEDSMPGVGRKIRIPSCQLIELPISGLSRLQLMTLEQLSGIDINSRILTQHLPRIKEISHEKNAKVSESVPVNEEKKSALKKSKSVLSSGNIN